MNLPNKITIFRICMIPFFVFFMLAEGMPNHNVIAAVIYIIASASDTLDGYIARKYDLVTNFGKFMDPIADKLLVSAGFILFTALGRMPAWIVIIFISREFIISGFRLVASDNGIVIAAGMTGKAKTVVQMAMSIMLIFDFENKFWQIGETVLVYAALILTVVSCLEYILKNKDVLKN